MHCRVHENSHLAHVPEHDGDQLAAAIIIIFLVQVPSPPLFYDKNGPGTP